MKSPKPEMPLVMCQRALCFQPSRLESKKYHSKATFSWGWVETRSSALSAVAPGPAQVPVFCLCSP